jgi:hypothetical protein
VLKGQLSEFQFNVETIITGVNEKGKVIRDQSEFEVYYLLANRNILNLKDHLQKLVEDINK